MDNKAKKRYSLTLILIFLALFTLLIGKTALGSKSFTALHVDTSTDAYYSLLKEQSEIWGLGKVVEEYVTNDRSYSWYIDQGNTGRHSGNNCGPASVTMAARWYHENTRVTAEKARRRNRPFGGWWYANDIEESLSRMKVRHHKVTLENQDTILALLRSGHILIVNNTMGGIPYNSNQVERTNRFYSFDSGHFFIVKGFVRVDGKVYFEVYDPNSWDMRYRDGHLMGQNRYYEGEALVKSILNWYPELVVIHKP